MKTKITLIALSVLMAFSCKKTTTPPPPSNSTNHSTQATHINMTLSWDGGINTPIVLISPSNCWYSINGGNHLVPTTSDFAYAATSTSVTMGVLNANVGDKYVIGYSTPIFFQLNETSPNLVNIITNGVITATVSTGSYGADNENNQMAITSGTGAQNTFSFTIH